MAQFWYKLVKSGARTLNDVPIKWRAEVKAMLEADG